MSTPFVGEIRMFAGTFAPRGWALCDGQLLAVSQNDALFSLIGTIYGGDGRTTFGLPDMRGRLPIHMGTGPGLSPRIQGSKGGLESVTLSADELPTHNHEVNASSAAGNHTSPQNHFFAQEGAAVYHQQPFSTNVVSLGDSTVTSIGGGRPHSNLMPSLCVNFIIALFGIYPSRN